MTVALPAAVRLNFCDAVREAADDARSAEHEQQVADDAAGDRGLDHRDVVRSERGDAR